MQNTKKTKHYYKTDNKRNKREDNDKKALKVGE